MMKSESQTDTDVNNDTSNNDNNNNDGVKVEEEEYEEDDDDECLDEEESNQNETNTSENAIKSESVDENEKTNLIVNYLPQLMTDEEFENLFKKFGNMKSCKIVRNRNTGYSYGFGFVDFETNEQALKAIEELNGQEVDTKKIKVAFARPAGQDIKQANLYVKNVPNTWSQDDVRKVFEPYGSIIQVRVLGNDRGVAFVLFDLRKQAEDALDALNGKQVDGCDKPFEIKFAADKKGEKRKSGKNNLGRRDDRGGGNQQRGSRNQNSNYNRNSRGDSRNRRSTSQNNQGRGSGRNGQYNQGNNNYGMNGGVGPVRQQPGTRMNRYNPFVPVQQPPMAHQPTVAPMASAYGYAQQQMIPYMMPNQSTMMQMNPHSMPMSAMNPYAMNTGAQMTPMGPYAPTPVAQTSAAMSNMYNVASNNMNNAAQMQPQLGQPMNMRGGISSGGTSSGSSGSQNQSDGVTLFVYNIGPNSDEDELRTTFGPYGDVLRCNVVRKTPGGETKGFGFVTLRSRDQANAAIAGLDGTMRNGKQLQVSFKK